MRQLTADTVIRVKASRPPLTGDTRIRLRQIKGLKEWVEDRHKYRTGDISETTGLQKQPDGSWKPPQGELRKDRWGDEIHKATSVNNINEKEFVAPTKSYVLPPINKKFTKAVGKKCKGLILSRHTINRMLKEHKEMGDGRSRRKILNNALNNFTELLYDRPHTKPNYYVVVKNGRYYDISVIDTERKDKYFEIVDWREINQDGYDDMLKRMKEEDGQILITDGVIRTGQPAGFLLFTSIKNNLTYNQT